MYENVTPESIKASILSNISDLDIREGSYINNLISPTAYKIWEYYQALNAIIPIVFVDETSGEYIDKRCADYGIVRKPGTKARVIMTLTGTDGTIIPRGKVFLTESGLEFTTIEEIILSGDTTAEAEAVEVGEQYNVESNTITQQFSSTYGLSTFTNAKAEGGTDPESDDALVKRLYDYLQLPATSGNSNHYRQWAKEVNGVGEAKIFPLWNGAGTVKVVVVDQGFRPASDEVVSACTAHIEQNRPIGASVTVVSATELAVEISATVKLSGAATQDKVKDIFLQKIQEYIEDVAFIEKELVYNRIGAMLMDIEGVQDYTALTLNGKTQSVILTDEQVPTIRTVVINVAD